MQSLFPAFCMNPKFPKADDTCLRRLEDESLLAEVSLGCDEAFTVLYERHCRSVFRVARRILDDWGEAEEIVQQVFLESYQRISQFNPQRGTLLSWLLSMAKYRAIDRRRHL